MSFKHQAQILRVARFNANMTQEQMADCLGMESAQHISNLERGEAAIPKKYWKKLAGMTGKEVLRNALLNDLRDEFKSEVK